MDLFKSIEVFREVCRRMSFSQAAEHLNLVPSAVSRQVRELERHLGVRLLQRTTRSIGLTADGARYLRKMDEISEYLGKEMTAEIFEVNTSTHYGRMVRVDDNTVILFGNMDEVFEYI